MEFDDSLSKFSRWELIKFLETHFKIDETEAIRELSKSELIALIHEFIRTS